MLKIVTKTKRTKKNDPTFLVIFFSGGLIFLTLLFLYSNWKITQRKEDLERQIRLLEARITQLQKDKAVLQKEIQEIENPYYQEKKLREGGYVREGEKVILVSGLEENPKESSSPEDFWSKIKNRLGL